FISLVDSVQAAVDKIPVDEMGGRLPLFALFTIAEAVTPELIAMLESDTGRKPSVTEAKKIYEVLAGRQVIAAVDGNVEKGLYLPRAISSVAWERLREKQPVLFRAMHAHAEFYERGRVDLDFELKGLKAFAAWTRFENPTWVQAVERWFGHAQWLSREQFEQMKPALVKIYLDAFWWWDDYLRSAATRRLGPALKRVAIQQQDELWMNALEKFSDHWVSSWDETVLRADPGQWHAVMDAITALLSMFGLRRGVIPRQPALRRIYILLCSFYGKALWYAGTADAEHAEAADAWLADAALACRTQDYEDARDNPNEWIGSWALLRRAEIWSALDPGRSRGFLDGLDRTAIDDDDNDLRVGIAMLIGDMQWRSGGHALALDTYSRAILISYAYNVKQEWRRQAPNVYTKSLYASTIGRVEQRVAELERAGERETIDTALAVMNRLFQPYWERVNRTTDPSAGAPGSVLPVPPPYADESDSIPLESEYVENLEHLALLRESTILEPNVLPADHDN
ncbi:MAG: hypothetical protein ACJ786_16445, partial [Catenulispora sp.]